MSRPASAEHGAVFDFASLTRELREEESYAREGHTARTLLRAPDLRVILVVEGGQHDLRTPRAGHGNGARSRRKDPTPASR